VAGETAAALGISRARRRGDNCNWAGIQDFIAWGFGTECVRDIHADKGAKSLTRQRGVGHLADSGFGRFQLDSHREEGQFRHSQARVSRTLQDIVLGRFADGGR
jgi:hypothetical protein